MRVCLRAAAPAPPDGAGAAAALASFSDKPSAEPEGLTGSAAEAAAAAAAAAATTARSMQPPPLSPQFNRSTTRPLLPPLFISHRPAVLPFRCH